MNETEPLYFTKFREHIDQKFETHVPQYFKDFQVHIDKKIESEVNGLNKKIESEINSLAIMIKDNFVTKDEFEDGLNEIRDTMATKDDIKDMVTKQDIKDMATKDDIKDMATKNDIRIVIEHIGSYEIRALNVEKILNQEHKPRIIDLEKEVFA